MTYYNLVALSPYSTEAGLLCQKVADTATECAYPSCAKEVVGCAVHEATIKTENGYKKGCHFLPICQKHKAWEFEKVNPNNQGGWIW